MIEVERRIFNASTRQPRGHETTREQFRKALDPRIAAPPLQPIEHPTMSQPNTPDVTAQEQVPASISAAAHAYQVAMQQQSATPPAATTPAPLPQALDSTKDVIMTDGTPDRPAVSLRASFLYNIEY
jgi:hypothetical protein